MRSEVVLTQQLEEASTKHLQDKQGLEKELEELRRAKDRLTKEQEWRTERVKAECESRLQSLDSRHAAELEQQRARADMVLRENEQLRRFLSEQRKGSTLGMTSLQGQLEGHMARLQQHTEELRGDLHTSKTDGLRTRSFSEVPPQLSSISENAGSGSPQRMRSGSLLAGIASSGPAASPASAAATCLAADMSSLASPNRLLPPPPL
mmetsp:Transcript_104518/g.213167  ORF Transcript_104518/g.213167 Transcript_104518/m.213167 type:complete len:207 (+) Transcript_104518:1-621(+)